MANVRHVLQNDSRFFAGTGNTAEIEFRSIRCRGLTVRGIDFVVGDNVLQIEIDVPTGGFRDRHAGKIPAIVYGGNKESVSITIAHKDIARAIENEAFFSHIIKLNVGKKPEQVIIKALQRHPAKPFILHADFLRVRADEEITVNVPIHFLNEEKCVGVKLGGGSIIHTLTELEISCLPKNLPEYLEVDMLEVDLGESVHITDVVLPEGVTSVALSHDGDDVDQSVASVLAPRGETEEEAEEAAAAAAEAEEAAGDETEAPAAGEEEKPDEGE